MHILLGTEMLNACVLRNPVLQIVSSADIYNCKVWPSQFTLSEVVLADQKSMIRSMF